MNRHQVEWRTSHVSSTDMGTWRGDSYPWIVPRCLWEESLWPGIRTGSDNPLAAYLDREVLAAMPCCPAARRGYQLFRQTALAEGIARSGKYDLTVSAVALDERNEGLNRCLRKLGLSDLRGWETVFRGRAMFAVFTHQQWVGWVREHDREGRWREWQCWIRDRYAI